jgi:hypothetical protein
MRESLRDYPKHYWFYTNIPSVDLLIKNVYILGSGQDNRPLKWMKPMLNVNMRHRPIAQILIRVASSQADISFNPAMFCDSYIQLFHSSHKPAYNFLTYGNNKGKAALSPRGLKSHVGLVPHIGD